jgi:TorA maturation chaperone TorD
MMDGGRRAVVIGINDYQADKIENLSGAVYDATEIRDILTQQGRFTIDDKHFLTNTKATSENIRTAISELFWKPDACEIALFYFSGHGKRDHLGHGYILPHDVQHAAPYVRGIRIQELKQLFLEAPNKETCIMILDCCYSGTATQGDRADADNAEHIESFRQELDLESEDKSKGRGSGRFIWASADADKTAREDEREHALGGGKHVHGLFSFQLIEGLRGGETDFGRISVGALAKHLEAAFKDSEHKPQLSAIAAIDMHEIWLAEKEEELERRILETLNEVERLLKDEPSPTHVMGAISRLYELKKRKLRPAETKSHWDRLGRIIEASANPAYQLWLQYRMKVLSKTNGGRWYSLLDDTLLNFDLEKICGLAEREMSFVASVLEAIEKDKGHEKVIRYINLMERGEEKDGHKVPLRLSPKS